MTRVEEYDALVYLWEVWFGSFLTPYDCPSRLRDEDRFTYAPQSYGYVVANRKNIYNYKLTPAGEKLLSSKRKDEVFLRQLLKFQLPSPYHKPMEDAANFNIKPFLEMLRLVRVMGTLKFDELQLFGMQLTDYHDFDKIVRKIETFRIAKAENRGNYKVFKKKYLDNELKILFQQRIREGKTKTRESNDNSLEKFLRTQSNNMRDYADACFRYLRATGLVAVSHVGKSLSIVHERMADVDYILDTVGREPVFVDDEDAYIEYLGKADYPLLLTDDQARLKGKIAKEFPDVAISLTATTDELKDMLGSLLERRKEETITANIAQIKNYCQYDDIQKTFDQITNNELYDTPLMLEWNTWRAMTMLDGGDIKANFNFDDYGNPLSTAGGNMSDIVCDYGDFMVCVEVTMTHGQRQYETESEPVARHLGKLRKTSGKPCYCLFVSPTINDACITHFYTLHHLNLILYGGKSTIVPMPLNIFKKMLEDSYKAVYTPNPEHVRKFFEASNEFAQACDNEVSWYEQITQKALHWLE